MMGTARRRRRFSLASLDGWIGILDGGRDGKITLESDEADERARKGVSE